MLQAVPPGRYRADIGGGELKVPESRIVAGLLLEGVDEDEWRQAIMVQNILQMRSPSQARRQSNLIRARLRTMEPDLWRLVRDGSQQVATHAMLAAAVKHSPLLADFLYLVVREQLRLFSPSLSRKLWSAYLEGCRARDTHMPKWSEATEKRLATSVFGILAEAGYISDTRRMLLQPVQIAPEVLFYLREHNEQDVLRAIRITP